MKAILEIDLLAIGQTKTKERNHQVGFMKDIYSNASLVMFWLCKAISDSDLAMSHFGDFVADPYCHEYQSHSDDLDCALSFSEHRP